MARTALALKYRPKTFDDLCSQESIKTILEEQIRTKTFQHCYLFTGPAGCGKAQPLDSLILTPSGYITMGDVQVGTQVITSNNNIGTITGIFPQGKRPNYKIILSDGTSINVSDEHLNVVYQYHNKEKKYSILTTKELIDEFNSTKAQIRVDIPSVDFDCKEVTINPYLLGCLLGDGSLSSGNFSFSNSEDDIIQRVDDILNKEYDMTLKHARNYDYKIQYNINPRHNGSKGDRGKHKLVRNYDMLSTLKGQLANYGLLCKSTEKHIPNDYLINSKEIRLELLRGLYDTDGYTDSRGYTSFTTSSHQLSEDFAFLVRSLGIRDTVTVSKSGYKDSDGNYAECANSYTHYLKIPDDIDYCKSIKHLNRKHSHQNNPIRHIVSIDYIGDVECQCIMIDHDDHTYISNDFIPTHNTTSARILANMINEGKGNPIEVDAASNSGVENIRVIIEDAKKKSLDSEYKVYIIDECHMLSTSAWNAFLKLLEEPPKFTIFILATTDPQKIIPTILSRVQRYDFTKIPYDVIVERLKYICDTENKEICEDGSQDAVNDIEWAKEEGLPVIDYTEDALSFIAKLSSGGMRDAITRLDKCISLSNEVTVENVVKALGTVDYDTFFKLLEQLDLGLSNDIIETIENVYNEGKDLKNFIKEFLKFMVDVCKYKLFDSFEYTNIPNLKQYDDILQETKRDNCFKIMELFKEINNIIRYETDVKYTIESILLSEYKE